jgi:hypothetical protein
MRTFRAWRTAPESWEKQREAGRYNPAIEMQYYTDKSYTVTLGAGTRDELDVFEEGNRIYVLMTNTGLGYVGMQVFEDGEEIADEFVQDYDEHGEYILGLTPIWRAKRLANWCDL